MEDLFFPTPIELYEPDNIPQKTWQDILNANPPTNIISGARLINVTIEESTIQPTVSVNIYVNFAVFASNASVAVGNGISGVAIPAGLNGKNLISVSASVYAKGITGTTDIQVRRSRAGTDADMLSTKVTIGDEFYVADGVVDTTKDDLATGDQIFVDVDAIHSGTAPLGLSVVLTFN
jgi:hypothetical protein